MSRLQEMLTTHPESSTLKQETVLKGMQSFQECAQTCLVCADACLGEEKAQNLRTCIRLNLDCADICEASARILARRAGSDTNLLRAQIEACAIACKVCADECNSHAGQHEHCRLCEEHCRMCEDTCRQLLNSF